MKKRMHTGEFIGAHIKVVEASHTGYEGIQGKVVDETKNTFVIENHSERTVPKRGCLFELTINDMSEMIDGNDIRYRPEDRIKRLG